MEIGLSKAEFERLLLERYGDKAETHAKAFEVYAQKKQKRMRKLLKSTHRSLSK